MQPVNYLTVRCGFLLRKTNGLHVKITKQRYPYLNLGVVRRRSSGTLPCAQQRWIFSPKSDFHTKVWGASIMGNGWAIGDLSSIIRTRCTYYYDAKTAADDLSNASSRMLLDGIRLIYLQINTKTGFSVFLTEQGYIKAEQVTGTNYLKYVKVSYPNGSVGIFGYESNTTQQLVYPLTKLTDARATM